MTDQSTDNRTYFPLPLRGDIFNKGRRIRLFEPFIYQDEEKGLIVTIPAGFVSDYNSTPFGLWNLFPPWEYPEAAIVHDWLYKHPQGLYKPAASEPISLNRGQIDDIHRRILDLLGASWSRRQSMWLGIRAGGWKSWNRYRKDPTLSDSGQNEPAESANQPLPENQNAPKSN